MFYLFWIISLISAFWLGTTIKTLKNKVETLEEVKEKIPNEPSSTLIDPLDPVAEAKYEQEQLQKKLNPDG